jgi:hypothetical protein
MSFTGASLGCCAGFGLVAFSLLLGIFCSLMVRCYRKPPCESSTWSPFGFRGETCSLSGKSWATAMAE